MGFWKRHADSFRYSNAQWLIITEPMEIIYLEQLLTCKEKKKQKKNQQLLMQIWKEKIKSWAEKCSELLPLSGLQNGVMNKDTSESSGYAFIQTLLHHPGWQEGQKYPNYYQHWDKWLCEELCQMWAGSCICACASQIPMALEIICFV